MTASIDHRIDRRDITEGYFRAIHKTRKLSIGSISERAAVTARHSILDWLGCAVAGSQNKSARQFSDVLAASHGEHPVIGTSQRFQWNDAALINGMNGHVLDFDDMLPAVSGHASAAILPALFVAATEENSTLDDLVVAMVAAAEIMAWLAKQIMPHHYDAGWHATGTLGAFGAAAAVSHLNSSSHEQWVTALDIASTQSAGLRALFGTIAKPMHAGKAAQSGLIAAKLAGINAAQTDGSAVTGPKGFLVNYGPGADRGYLETSKNEKSLAIEGMLYKNYASCFMTQSAVDAALEIGEKLRRQRKVPEELGLVEIWASPKLQDVCAIADPKTPEDAKFSLQATVALALSGQDLTREDSFTAEALQEPKYRSLHEKTQLAFDETLSGAEPTVRIRATTVDGATYSLTVDRGRPAEDLDAQQLKLTDKFHGLVQSRIGSASAGEIASKVLKGDIHVRSLIGSLTTTQASETK